MSYAMTREEKDRAVEMVLQLVAGLRDDQLAGRLGCPQVVERDRGGRPHIHTCKCGVRWDEHVAASPTFRPVSGGSRQPENFGAPRTTLISTESAAGGPNTEPVVEVPMHMSVTQASPNIGDAA